jgi:hypothetical protein
MECYRRAMVGEQTLEGRRENLKSRTDAADKNDALRQGLH